MKHVFPPDGAELDATWFAPLQSLERALNTPHGLTSDRFFDPHDFMIMARVVRPSRPDLWLYKHSYTRRYVNLDAAGHAYRYHPPRALQSTSQGQYRRHKDLRAAVQALGLWELPWMKPGLEPFRAGTSWDDRWLIFDDRTGDLPPMDDLEVPDFAAGCAQCRR
jgi:hypothetical protein